MSKIIFVIVVAMLVVGIIFWRDIFMTAIENITITVVYDNNAYKEGLEIAWGFSCVVKLSKKMILFDTGGDGDILLANMEKLGIDPGQINVVILSHIHHDHTGGLQKFLEKNSDVVVYLPKSFPDNFKNEVKEKVVKVVEVDGSLEICESVYSTGELDGGIKEQSLIIKSKNGLIVITGCAHPGIVKIVKKTKDLMNEKILFVMGGFHLGSETERTIKNIISDFKNLGVKYVGPCHCSGDMTRQLFKEEYGQYHLNVGVGKTINLRQGFGS